MTNPTPAAAPDPARWLTELMANPLSPLQSFGSGNPATPLAALPMPMFAPWLEATNAFVQWQQQAFQQMVALSPLPAAPTDDRRFAGEVWRQGPAYDAVARTYLMQSEQVHKALDSAPLAAREKAPPAFDLLFWNGDDTNLPGPMFCWYLRNTYLENKLSEPGATMQCGVPVDLGAVKLPAFLYASREDHIVPWQTAYASTRLLGGDDIAFVLGGSGHIAGVISPPARKKRTHWIGSIKPGAGDWLDGACDVPGSWWPEWIAWLKPNAGAMVAAPALAGNRRHAMIEPAPGRFVKAKAP